MGVEVNQDDFYMEFTTDELIRGGVRVALGPFIGGTSSFLKRRLCKSKYLCLHAKQIQLKLMKTCYSQDEVGAQIRGKEVGETGAVWHSSHRVAR
jgi:hypothetical protein